MKKGVKIEMDRFLFLELYRTMETYSKDPRHEMKVIALDFVARNKAKYDQYNSVIDEAIAYEPRKDVVTMKGEGNTEFVVLRARKLPSGKRQYWLSDAGNRAMNGTYPIDHKVSASSIDRKVRELSVRELKHLSTLKLPKVT